MRSSVEITELLIDWSKGNKVAEEELFLLVEKELRRMAHRYMRDLEPGNTLQTTALINEAYIRLVDQNRVQWQNRTHFFAIAATLMRRILINYIRAGKCEKRGGDISIVPILNDDEVSVIDEKSDEILALEQALCRLYELDERKAKLVELRYYGGLTVEEAAEFLNIGIGTAIRDWNMARAWLAREINK